MLKPVGATISPGATAFLRSQPSLSGPPSLYTDIASPAQVPVFRARSLLG